jgi:protein required for attachment to host cells
MPVHDLSNETWVLIADGEKALFLVNDGDAEYPVLTVRREEHQPNPPTRDQAANRPGQVQESHAPGSRSYEDTDWHQLAKDRFADHLADMLYERAHRGDFRRIVLVAAPGVLGELREKMHKEVADRVVGEVPKTLTNHPVEEIEKVLKSDLVPG